MKTKDPKSPQEFKALMKSIRDKYGHDPEECHIEMDTVLCETLEALGYKDGIAIFRSTSKWYA